MRNRLKLQLRDISKMWLFMLTLTTFSCVQKSEPTPSAQVNTGANTGIIYAKPEDIASNISLEKVLQLARFSQSRRIRLRFSFPALKHNTHGRICLNSSLLRR